MDPSELQSRVGRALRRLPPPSAPSTLLPRVMLAVRVLAARPWYTRAWVTWPGAWQAISAVLLLSLVTVVVLAAPTLSGEVGGPIVGLLATTYAWVLAETQGMRAAISTLEVLWRAIVQPISGYLLVLLALMWVACVAFGVALTRVAFGEVTQS